MQPDPNAAGLIATLTSYVFVATEVLKVALGIEGDKPKVRILAVILALLISFGNTFFASATIPAVTAYLIWGSLLQGLVVAGAAIGIHSARTPGVDPDSPLAPLADSLNTAQKANEKAQTAIENAQTKAATVADAIAENKADLPAVVVHGVGGDGNADLPAPQTTAEQNGLLPPANLTGKNDFIPE